MTSSQHEELKQILFPGDQKEAVAIALCGRRHGDRRHRLLVREVHGLPVSAYNKRVDSEVSWSTEALISLLEVALDENYSVIKFHSHPSGQPYFSSKDDFSDSELLPMVQAWIESEVPHGSVVMTPDGQMFGRALSGMEGKFIPIHAINVVGDDLHFWYPNQSKSEIPSFVASHKQAFGQGTTECLQRLSIAVVGCSGTGSPVIEQLVRLGVGEIIIVDNDRMEDRNVNRILNSTMSDVRSSRFKVDVLFDAINQAGFGTRVIPIKRNLWNRDVVECVAQCDVVFGCMDTIDGRYLLNKLATYYLIPYFDIGVKLDAISEGEDKGNIREVCGTVHYLQPGKSSLMSRGLFDMDEVRGAGLYRNDPKAYANQAREGYIAGVEENKPAVISVNMFGASLVVNDFLARIHPYREEPNKEYANITFSLASMELFYESEGVPCSLIAESIGIGDTEPFLGELELSVKREVA
ncbi:MAG: ThiF family adenylyltransferase [Candidatus Nitrospinota bacterium M3_3B_026]